MTATDPQSNFPSGAGPVALRRRPVDHTGTLRAWDAADALLVDAAMSSTGPVLVVGDSFGALAVALRHRSPVSWSDSAITHLATIDNVALQSEIDGDVGRVTMVADPEELTRGGRRFDTVVWRIPNGLHPLRHQASVVQAVATSGARVLAAGMDKHLPPTAKVVLSELGEVTTHPGRHKAHLFEMEHDIERPTVLPLEVPVVSDAATGLVLRGGHQAFSAERVDAGSLVLVSALTSFPASPRVADLCCGGGVLGLAVRRRQPAA